MLLRRTSCPKVEDQTWDDSQYLLQAVVGVWQDWVCPGWEKDRHKGDAIVTSDRSCLLEEIGDFK